MTATAPSKLLKWDEKQAVRYAIPLPLRDEQIKHAIKAVSGRIQRESDRAEPIAVVGYGPSLRDTWGAIKDFKYVIACSGASKFLIERGIVPQWHAAVDPLPKHTVELIGTPHPDVTYLIASTCHPDVFAHLKGYQVKLWHVFDSSADAQRTLPAGEWAIMGGCDIGLRCLTLARFLGFREMHVFGLDGSYGPEGRHAAAHPVPGKRFQVEYPTHSGQFFETTPGMLEAARQILHELNELQSGEQGKDVSFTFYGTGLIQAMTKDRVPEHRKHADIAFAKVPVISAEYAALNAKLHEQRPEYGMGGARHKDVVLKLVEQFKTTSVLDYGCGKGHLAKALDFPIWEYDPAIPEKSESPRRADIVICTDVLEHIEPELLHVVLKDLHRVTGKVAYFVVHTTAARKTLPDGRNTHLIQEGASWWLKQISTLFLARPLPSNKGEVRFVAVPK